jgi:hypothetical protein
MDVHEVSSDEEWDKDLKKQNTNPKEEQKEEKKDS